MYVSVVAISHNILVYYKGVVLVFSVLISGLHVNARGFRTLFTKLVIIHVYTIGLGPQGAVHFLT